MGGTLTQAAALHVGSLGVVQLVLTTQLIFTLPLGSAWRHRWPRSQDWLAALAVCLGLALFLGFPGLAPPAGTPQRLPAALATIIGLALAGLLLVIARGRRRRVHTWLAAAAAGICSAIMALLIKRTVADLVDRGVAATARDWPGYCLAVAALAAFLCEQEAFTGRSLATAVAVMTVTDPAASLLLSDIAFQVHHPFEGSTIVARRRGFPGPPCPRSRPARHRRRTAGRRPLDAAVRRVDIRCGPVRGAAQAHSGYPRAGLPTARSRRHPGGSSRADDVESAP